ncbi:hypothetical protein [Paracoccus sp. SJTW-4]|uniref:hypothetical protein n=1 Tax=Paracoccus sp. SJTW-4 TaxID=3078428 RepID=UPI0039EC80F8
MESVNFDATTARMFDRNPNGSGHPACIDAAGSICIVVEHEYGNGCAVNAKAIHWGKNRKEQVFIRLMNKEARLDMILPLASIRFGQVRRGPSGYFYAVDPRAPSAPDFPPPTVFDDAAS